MIANNITLGRNLSYIDSSSLFLACQFESPNWHLVTLNVEDISRDLNSGDRTHVQRTCIYLSNSAIYLQSYHLSTNYIPKMIATLSNDSTAPY